ncbi:MAG: GntR family transcriptional regulator [Lentisphaerae bacterium]|nr:GntR family transcriptional regulator [Lentisphaerota bacterium]
MTVLNKSEMIANALFDRIRSGELTGQLPSDKKVAEDFGVALMTATRALTLLQERGAVVRIPRKGTFVLAGDARELTVSCLPRFFEIFRKWMQIHHPEITLKHQPPRSGYSGDLRVMTTYSIFTSYNVEISQFSRLREERLRQSGRFWDKLCDLYHKDNRLYGVPYLFSPVLLHYNRSLMREIAPDFDPVALDWDTFTGLLEKAVDAGFNGIDLLCYAQTFFFNMVYCLAGHSPDESSVLKAAALFKKIIAFQGKSGVEKETFSKGRTLFALSPRHQTYDKSFEDYDIAPMPYINGVRSCPLASEALVVSSHCTDTEFLHDICEETLTPEFQRLVTASSYGVAADKSVAFESLKTSGRRDDFFFTETANAAVIFKDYPLELVQDLSLCIGDFRSGDIDFDEFKSDLSEAFARQKRAEKRKKRFLEMHEKNEYDNQGEYAV